MKRHAFLSCICLLLLVSLALVPVMAATVSCPPTCSCLLPADAAKMNTPGLCSGKQMVCGGDAKNEKYCYAKPVTTVVPQLIISAKPFVTATPTTVPPQKCASGCTCMSTADGKGKGLAYCNNRQMQCGYDSDKTPLYCFALPAATVSTGPTIVTGLRVITTVPTTVPGKTAPTIVTGLHVITTAPTPAPVPAGPTEPCAAGCACIASDQADAAGLKRCTGTTRPCGYDTTGRSLYCYAVDRVAMVSPVPAAKDTTAAALDITYATVPPMEFVHTTTGQTVPASGGNLFAVIESFFASLFGGGTARAEAARPSTDSPVVADKNVGLSYCQSRGLADCNGACADLVTDPRNCGGCGRACYDGEICCSGTCVANTSAENCGTCGNTCPAGSPCLNGRCDSWGCYYGTELCNNTCVRLSRDRSNCGACGNTCPSPAVCDSGTCMACGFGTTVCGNSCADTSADRNNCGSCRNACGEEEICREGTCVSCHGGSSRCGNSCADLQTDNANCGRCGYPCAERLTCRDGECQCPDASDIWCPTGRIGVVECVDPRTDEENCGGCSAGMAAARRCLSGETCCNGACSLLPVDRLNCGTCGNACPDDPVLGAADCREGACTYCPAGRFGCVQPNGRALCIDIMTSQGDCGACGNRCADGKRCCGGVCSDLSDDRMNCGSCGNACLGGQMCCDGRCTGVLFDDNNCGDCGHACNRPDRSHCFEGRCCDLAAINCL